MNFEILKEEWITNSEVKEILGKRKDLEFEQRLAKEHVKNFSKLSVKRVKEMKEELKSLDMTKLKPKLIIKIIDIMPEDKKDLDKILSMEIIPFNDEEIKKIMEIVEKYRTYIK